MKRRAITLALMFAMTCSAWGREQDPVSIQITAPVESVKSALIFFLTAGNWTLESDRPEEMTFTMQRPGDGPSEPPVFFMQVQFSHSGAVTTITAAQQFTVNWFGKVKYYKADGKGERAGLLRILEMVKQRAEAADAEEANRPAAAEAVCNAHQDWKPIIHQLKVIDRQQLCEAVAAHQVGLGMTAEQVKLSWGEPNSINQTVVTGVVSEQWVYRSRQYVYLKNGIVTGMQTPK
jgi:hypothetical protein